MRRAPSPTVPSMRQERAQLQTRDAAADRRRTGRRWLAVLERQLPHGWGDFLRQVAIWLGFVVAYQIARGLANRGPAPAFRNARHLISLEEHLGGLFELHVQRLALDGGAVLVHAIDWSYWLSQFAVVIAGLVWIYLRRNDAYLLVRNTYIVTNALGLVGYMTLPTAPPRLFPGLGFVDTLAGSEVLNHGSGLVRLLANPYAAMPSLHAADALIIGVALATLVRRPALKLLFLAYPLWVWFSLIATANHFWLDVLAGVILALLGALLAARFTKPFAGRRRHERPCAGRSPAAGADWASERRT